MRWLELVKDYDCEILYHLKKANVVADALNRKCLRQVFSTVMIAPQLASKMVKAEIKFVVIVDCATKSAHFLPVKTTYTVDQYAELYVKETACLHGAPKSIVSNRNPKFTSKFWTGKHVFLRVSLMNGIRRFAKRGKLSRRFIGPFEILEKVEQVFWKVWTHFGQALDCLGKPSANRLTSLPVFDFVRVDFFGVQTGVLVVSQFFCSTDSKAQVDSPQTISPIQLDPEAIIQQVKEWEEASAQHITEGSKEKVNSEIDQAEKGETSRKRKRIKPSWLRDFVLMKNEEIAALLQALDLKWEQRSESQMETIKMMIDERFNQNSQPSPVNQVGEASGGRDSVRERSRRSDAESDCRDINSILKTLRVKVPRFDGQNVDDWIYKINKFFDLHRVDYGMRLAVVPFHLDGPPSSWFQWMEKGGSIYDWDSFLRELQLRFGTSIYDDPLGRISKLTQTGKVSEYRQEFEMLMPRITGVADSMFLNFFIWGLKLEIRRELLMAPPANLADAMAKAQLFEDRNEDLFARQRDHNRTGWISKQSYQQPNSHSTFPTTYKPSTGPPSPPIQPLGKPANTISLPIKKLSPSEMKERREKGLCYTCEEKFHYGHKCKIKMLIMCVHDEEDASMGADEEEHEIDSPEEEVSLNSLSNSLNPRIFRITAKHGNESLEVLVDTGSNNNFIQESLATQLNLPWEETKCFKVYMGNGNFLLCYKLCKEVELWLQGHRFIVDLYVLPICGLDVVLGMQWLQTLGPCIHDHKALTMEFTWQGNIIKLSGSTQISGNHLTYTQLTTLLREGEVRGLFRLETTEDTKENDITDLAALEAHFPPQGRGLLSQFAAVFATPNQLPPFRSVDHRIFLQPGSTPVNVRPYRYPYFQKDVIEKLVQEMQDVGFIRPSTSPYSSPVLLVKKKDGSWRFCVDYRALNGLTIKDRFPIPTIDELLDELGGATVFSKLDLRAGYHQIRMDRRDIHKTAFRTHQGHYEFVVMPFGLTNAPSTFQAAMNQVFRPYLRHFVTVFFYDILVYSNNETDHAQHLAIVLRVLRDTKFFAKASKCNFFQKRVEYLGHLVSSNGVQADPSKITAMNEWPVPTSLKQLRGFLGLTGYYRRFVSHYATIAAPLTDLLKRDNFKWTAEAATAFAHLKKAMTDTPVLKLPDFSKEFIVETDASNVGIGAVLMQDGHPLAYFSKKLGPRFMGSSAYLREMRAIVEAVNKWRQYLLGRHFIIRTDHRSLRELLTQVIQTPEQQQFIRKLLGFHFTIEYKAGTLNSAADALSRKFETPSSSLLIGQSAGCFDFLEELQQENITCPDLRLLHTQLQQGQLDATVYSQRDGLMYYRQKLFISAYSNLKQKLLHEFHDTPMGGHAGIERTYLRLGANFFWHGMRSDVKQFVATCTICQTVKHSTSAPYGLLQPLDIPERVWEDLAMDFIVGLPNSNGVTNILVVIDRFTKYAHFGALPRQYSATKVAELFSNMVIKLHGLPRTIVSDRDPVFTSAFWKKLFELMGTKLKMSSAYHPQTDGQTEVTNRYLEQYLRAFTVENPKQWSKFLCWAEYHYNTSHHSAIAMTPFQAVYGRIPPSIPTYIRGSTTVQAVEEDLLTRDDILQHLKDNLLRAQNRMCQQANKKRKDISFQIGDLVLVKLQPYRQSTVAHRNNFKLSRRYFGPFEVIGHAGPVAYTLKLPQGSRIHPTFHVSLLKPFRGSQQLPCYPLPEFSLANKPILTPLAILATRINHTATGMTRQVLVQWTLSSPEDATWEDFDAFIRMYNLVDLEDKVVFGEGSSDSKAQVDSPQTISPIQLDPEAIIQQVKEWEEASAQHITEGSKEKVNSEIDQAEKGETSRKRKRIKPSWLRDFVLLWAR
ncbi:uncharacterized protein LOC133032379 [Cannabis sativa]|uniref:uncharacterized protein LOC133032379 n=1 Tax=Cannabis sativa TaxID=3483 RepID=UPI0029CA27BF|nr:uncharacterized protein LOC133032379 [Cannabis sativa]